MYDDSEAKIFFREPFLVYFVTTCLVSIIFRNSLFQVYFALSLKVGMSRTLSVPMSALCFIWEFGDIYSQLSRNFTASGFSSRDPTKGMKGNFW